MKKLLYGCFLLLVMACSKKEDLTPLVLEKGDSAYFNGTILGKSIRFQENEQVQNGGVLARYTLADKTIPMQTFVLFNISDGKEAYLDIYTPSIDSEKFDFDNLKKILAVGKKNLETVHRPILPYQGIFKGFTFNYTFKGQFYTSSGQQDDGYLEIVEIKEVLPKSDAQKALQIKFRLNIKLYNAATKEYVGMAENVEFLTKYYHKPQ